MEVRLKIDADIKPFSFIAEVRNRTKVMMSSSIAMFYCGHCPNVSVTEMYFTVFNPVKSQFSLYLVLILIFCSFHVTVLAFSRGQLLLFMNFFC